MEIKLLAADSPQWGDAAHTCITIRAVFSHLPNEVLPFMANPNDPEAHGRDAYARAAAGEFGVVAEYVPVVVPVPAVVEMRQARLALLGAGLLDTVEAAIAGMPGTAGKAAQIEWEFARTLSRDHPLTLGLSESLGLQPADLDALFTQAAAIQ